MRKLLIINLLLLACRVVGAAQNDGSDEPTFTARASRTEVLLGNYIEVSFVLENGRGGKFFPPDWAAAGFAVRGGPNQSSQFSMTNGETKSTLSYSYFVEPQDTGALFIPEAVIINGEDVYKTEALTIRTLANPEGIIEGPESGEQPEIWGRPRTAEPPAKAKKKRQTTRI